jgi:hypothetical protein
MAKKTSRNETRSIGKDSPAYKEIKTYAAKQIKKGNAIKGKQKDHHVKCFGASSPYSHTDFSRHINLTSQQINDGTISQGTLLLSNRLTTTNITKVLTKLILANRHI